MCSDLKRSHPQVEGGRLRGAAHRQGQPPAVRSSGERQGSLGHRAWTRCRPPRESHPAGCRSGVMATHYPIVFEQEESGAYSAYVAGLPVYAQGATRGKAASGHRANAGRVSRGPSSGAAASGGAGRQSVGPNARPSPPEGQSGDGGRSGRESHQPAEGRQFAGEWPSRRAPAKGRRSVASRGAQGGSCHAGMRS